MFNKEGFKKLAMATGLSQKRLADAIGIQFGTLRSYIEGEQPCVENLVKIADYFAVPLDFLMGRCTEEQANSILDNYSANFMALRLAPYESYLIGRAKLPSNFVNNRYNGEEPYPYNLVDAINGEPIDWVLRKENIDGLEWAVSTLNERERLCVNAYYREGNSLSAVGKLIGVTTERARQILHRAVRRLCHPSKASQILNGWHSIEEIDTYINTVLKEKEKALAERELFLKEKENALTEKDKKINAIADELRLQGRTEQVEDALRSTNDMSLYSRDLCCLDLSVRPFNCLYRAGIRTVGDIISSLEENAENFKHIRNLGMKSYTEVLRKLDETFCTRKFTDTYLNYGE